MNRILIGSFTVALLFGSLLAQSPPPSRGSEPQQQQAAPSASPAEVPPAGEAPRIASGSVIPVQLTKSVDAKKVKTGDEVVAKVTIDLKTDAGAVILPKDTKVIGHVTEAQARSKEQKESQLAIAFDHAVLNNGEAMQMPMSIQAIIAPPNANSGNAPDAQPTTSYPTTGGASTAPGGRPGSMGETTPSTASVSQTIGSAAAPAAAQAPQHITGDTKGVVGIANLDLSAASDTMQGSVVSSERNNVKLDDGTFLLLRVN